MHEHRQEGGKINFICQKESDQAAENAGLVREFG